MILRTPPQRKRRAESRPPDDGYDQSTNSNMQLMIYEDLPVPEHSHDYSNPITSEQMLCTYQCRQMVKSEFFDALSSAEKEVRDHQSKLDALNDDLCKAEAERKKFRDQLFNAEQELAAAKGREHMLQEQLRKEVEFTQEQLRKQILAFNELEVKFRNETDQRKKAELASTKADEKAKFLDEKLGTLSESLGRRKSFHQSEIEQMKSESKFSDFRLRADLEKMQCRAENAEKESELLKEQLEKFKKQLDECIQEKLEVEKNLSSFSSLVTPSKDADLLVKHLQDELRRHEIEVCEARKIKASHESIELLKEKLHEEKSRRERAEIDLLKLADLQSIVKMLEDELTTWKSSAQAIPGVSHADDLSFKFASLQKEVIESMMREGEAQASLKQVQVALDSSMLEKQIADTDAKMARDKAESMKTEIRKLEFMFGSITEERDRLRNVVKDLSDRMSLEGGTRSSNESVVQELETALAKKDKYARELENNLVELKDINSRHQQELKFQSERLNNEERRVKMLERESDRLRSDISLLESKVGHGDFSSANTKVLRMVNTLAFDQDAKQTIEVLQNELQMTKDKLQAVEELKKQSPDSGFVVDSYVAGKIKQLKEQIATLEKREKRYKTVFADRISFFKRACCEFFGYKIVMDDHHRPDGIPTTRFILHSIYAMSDEEKLEFEYEYGNPKLLVNGYTSQPDISRQVETFIRKMNSIPALTSNLTLESVNKRTLS